MNEKEWDEMLSKEYIAWEWMEANPDKWDRDIKDHYIVVGDASEIPSYVLEYFKSENENMDGLYEDLLEAERIENAMK